MSLGVKPAPEDIMREALRDLGRHLPSARGMDPASRANMYRNELERRRGVARQALSDAAAAALAEHHLEPNNVR